ncbi:hypothetical protein JCM15765_05920 [Paradesulfitobacterium aromaticivorans]
MTSVNAPMEGKVFKINVQVGDKVQIDDEIIVLEAMKMETPIYASDNGTVKEIKVKEGDAVSEEQVLIVIE